MRHSLFLRIFWVFAAIVFTYRAYVYVSIVSNNYTHWDFAFVGSVTSCLVLWVIAILGVLGLFPGLGKYLEANPDFATLKEAEDGENMAVSAFALLMRRIFAKDCLFYIVSGFIGSAARGLVLLLMFQTFGTVFGAGRYTENDQYKLIGEIMHLILLFTIFCVLDGVAAAMWGIGSEKLVNGKNGLRNDLFKGLLHQELGYLHSEERSTGVLCSRFAGDAERVKIILTLIFPKFTEAISIVYTSLKTNCRLDVVVYS